MTGEEIGASVAVGDATGASVVGPATTGAAVTASCIGALVGTVPGAGDGVPPMGPPVAADGAAVPATVGASVPPTAGAAVPPHLAGGSSLRSQIPTE